MHHGRRHHDGQDLEQGDEDSEHLHEVFLLLVERGDVVLFHDGGFEAEVQLGADGALPV